MDLHRWLPRNDPRRLLGVNAVAVGLTLVAGGLFVIDVLFTRHGFGTLAGIVSLVLASLIIAGAIAHVSSVKGMLWIDKMAFAA